MELLVRVKDKIGSDVYHDVKLTKRGHVIVVKPDGHDWGARELDNPDWRIIRIPGISEAEATAMLAEEPGLDTNRMKQRRAFKLDLDNGVFKNTHKNFIDDDSRQTRHVEINISDLRQLKKQLKPVKDPDPLP